MQQFGKQAINSVCVSQGGQSCWRPATRQVYGEARSQGQPVLEYKETA